MEWWIWIVIILVVVVIVQVVAKKPAKTKKAAENDQEAKEFQYKKKSFLTPTEKSFLETLKTLTNYNLIVIPQINLATIVQKIGEFRYQNELYRNIDFGIFNKEYNLLLLIELNDSSHIQKQRKNRDLKVKDIVYKAEIKLITFYTDKPNTPEYVIERILGELNIEK